MPILGYRSNDNVRNKQIAEILDEDTRIYKQIFEKEKQKYSGDLSTQLTPKLATLNVDLTNKMQTLTDRFNELVINVSASHIKEGHISIDEDDKEEVIDVDMAISDIISVYNQMIMLILTPSLDSITKNKMQNQIFNVIPHLTNTIQYMNTIINDIFDMMRDGRLRKEKINIMLNYFVFNYATLKLMYDNIENQKFYILTTDLLFDNYNKVVRQDFNFKRVKDILYEAPHSDFNKFVEQRAKLMEAEIGKDLKPEQIMDIVKEYEKKHGKNPFDILKYNLMKTDRTFPFKYEPLETEAEAEEYEPDFEEPENYEFEDYEEGEPEPEAEEDMIPHPPLQPLLPPRRRGRPRGKQSQPPQQQPPQGQSFYPVDDDNYFYNGLRQGEGKPKPKRTMKKIFDEEYENVKELDKARKPKLLKAQPKQNNEKIYIQKIMEQKHKELAQKKKGGFMDFREDRNENFTY